MSIDHKFLINIFILFFFYLKLPQLQENGSSSQNNEGAGRSPRQSPDHQHYHSDCGSNSNAHIQRASDLLMAVSVSAEVNKMKITEVAVSAMEELAKKALAGAPLWQLQEDGKTEVLSDLEYMREFGHIDATLMDIMKMVEVGEPQRLPISLDTSTNSGSSFESEYRPILPQELLGPEPLHTEASRKTGLIRVNPLSIVELLMDLVGFNLFSPVLKFHRFHDQYIKLVYSTIYNIYYI